MMRTFSAPDLMFPDGTNQELFPNRNVDWIYLNPKATFICYILFVLLLWLGLHVSQFFSSEDCWTVTNVVHGVVRVLTNKYLFSLLLIIMYDS